MTFTATVSTTTTGSPTPTGTVNFYWQVGAGARTQFDGAPNTTLVPSATVAGQATATGTISNLVGSATAYTITAEYGGDTNHTVSTPMTSSSSWTVNPQATTTALVTTRALPNGSTFGENVTFTATVSHLTTAPLAPAGSLSFYEGMTLLAGPTNLDSNFQASFTTNTLSVLTSHTISAVFTRAT